MTGTAVGRHAQRPDGSDKVQGATTYVADMAPLPHMLYGAVVRSPYPHARILDIDVSEAAASRGVLAVITGRDVPSTLIGRTLRDMPILARDEVRFAGEKVAAVAATSTEEAEQAAALIRVEYEPIPAVFHALPAMLGDAPLLHPNVAEYAGLEPTVSSPPPFILSRVPPVRVPIKGPTNVFNHVYWETGGVESALAKAPVTLERRYTTPRVHQGYLEPHACIVSIDGTDVHVWATNKAPFLLRTYLSEASGLPEENIVVNPSPIGGDFGGKGSFMDVPIAYFLAKATGRPVRMVMDYGEELSAGAPRHASIVTVTSGSTEDGQLLAWKVDAVFNSGAYGAFKPGVMLPHVHRSVGPYRIPNVRIDSRQVYTNTVPCGYMRGPGSVQAVFAGESHMDELAHALGLDPLALRLKNVLQSGDVNPLGVRWSESLAEETLQAAVDAIGWGEPKGHRVGRGVSLGEHHGTGGIAGVTLGVNQDGSLTLHTPTHDTGVGSHLMLQVVVAESLGVSVDDVHLALQDTRSGAWEFGASGDRVTVVNGGVALRAAEELKARLATIVAEQAGSPVEDVRYQNGTFYAGDEEFTLRRLAETTPPEALSARVVSGADEPDDPDFWAQAAEVEVDAETGQVRLLRFATAHDCGTVLNPVTHQGQIDGGVVQGLGHTFMEELLLDDGQVVSGSLGDYRLPTIMDTPALTTVLLRHGEGRGPFQSKSIGEIALLGVAPAVANAIEDAVGARIRTLPLTAERVYQALRDSDPSAGSPTQRDD